MPRTIARRASLAGLAALHLLMTLVLTVPVAQAQDNDSVSPRIVFEPLGESRRGSKQVFTATVTDDVGVERVVLHHRSAGAERYDAVAMAPLGGTGIYTASITSPAASVEAIEFYIEARDLAGNRSIEGFAFDPLERRLVDASPIAGNTASPTTEGPTASGMSTSRKVLYGVLGVLAIGAIAAAAGGGGGGDSGAPLGDDPGGSVTVTIVADPLP